MYSLLSQAAARILVYWITLKSWFRIDGGSLRIILVTLRTEVSVKARKGGLGGGKA